MQRLALESLPNYLLMRIALYLDVQDLLSFFLLSKQFRDIFQEDGIFWKETYQTLMSRVAPIPITAFGTPTDYRHVVTQQLFFKTQLKGLPNVEEIIAKPIEKAPETGWLDKQVKKLFSKKSTALEDTMAQADEKPLLNKLYKFKGESLLIKSFDTGDLYNLIKSDNFDGFIGNISNIKGSTLDYIKQGDFKNFHALANALRADQLADVCSLDFVFVYDLMPLIIKANLPNLFEGFIKLFLVHMMLCKETKDQEKYLFNINSVEGLINNIFSSNKPYFIETFLRLIHQLSDPASFGFYAKVLNKLCEVKFDVFKSLDSAPRDSIMPVIEKKICEDFDINKWIVMFLRLLKIYPEHLQFKLMNALIENFGYRRGSLLDTLKVAISSEEFSCLSQCLKIPLKCFELQKELKTAEQTLASFLEDSARKIRDDKISQCELEEVPAKTVELSKPIVKLKEQIARAKVDLDYSISQKPIEQSGFTSRPCPF